MPNFGERIKAARLDAGLNQKALAEKAGVATITIQQYERGVREPRLKQLARIAKALNMSAHEMIGDNW